MYRERERELYIHIYIYIYTHTHTHVHLYSGAPRSPPEDLVPVDVPCSLGGIIVVVVVVVHTCHNLPPSEIDLGLFLAVFTGSEGRYLFQNWLKV